MGALQKVFSNREISIIIWVLIAFIVLVFTKPGRRFFKSTLGILLSRKLIIFYAIFLSYSYGVIYILRIIGFWNASLLKDTFFWVILVELPLFAKTIENAKGEYFFARLIRNSLRLVIFLEFVINFWTFGLITEIIIVPLAVLFGALYALSATEKKYQPIKYFFDRFLPFYGISVIINAIIHLLKYPSEMINTATVKEFSLPLLLLFLNLPIVYGLALYNMYEQVFIRVRGDRSEKFRIKLKVFQFAGINLSRIAAVRNHTAQTLMISLTETDMKANLYKLEDWLSLQVGDNYMKRSRFYIIWSVIGILICIIGIIISNSDVSLKDVFSFRYSLDFPRIKEIITYICSFGLVTWFCFLIFSLGLLKKKGEELSQVKKYSLYTLFYLIKRQKNMLNEFPPLDAPKELFTQYITTAYELKLECDKSIAQYTNLFSTWELDTIKQLLLSTEILIHRIGITETDIKEYNLNCFDTYFKEKTVKSVQNEKINVFTSDVQEGLEKYTKQIQLCFEEFKNYM